VDVTVSDIRLGSPEQAIALHLLLFRIRHHLVRDPIRHGIHSSPMFAEDKTYQEVSGATVDRADQQRMYRQHRGDFNDRSWIA
jgi:hypothetical protein